MVKPAALCLAVALFGAQVAVAQPTGVIRGVVRDSANHPMANADVFVLPEGGRTRTDSAGRFSIGSLPGRQYTVRARRVGYLPTEWTVDLSKSGQAEIQLTLGPRLSVLDTVYIAEDQRCEPRKYEGFLCRAAKAKGIFVDYTDIDTMDVVYSAELLRDVGGFTFTVHATRNGPTRVAASRHCTIVLMNGVPAPWSAIPEEPYMIMGIEIYKSPKDIPKEYSRYTWGMEGCQLVAYWTYDFTMKPAKPVRLPRQP